MNPFRLRTYNETPPGAYGYRQFTGIPHDFPPEPLIEAMANIVRSFRSGNGLPRSEFIECLEDVDRQTCKRLGNDPKYCVESTDPFTVSGGTYASAANSGGCKGCGAKFTD